MRKDTYIFGGLLLVLLLIAWISWIYSDTHQIRMILRDAPMDNSVFADTSDKNSVERLLRLAIYINEANQAINVTKRIKDEYIRSEVSCSIAERLIEAGETQKARNVMQNILEDITKRLGETGPSEGTLKLANSIPDAIHRDKALVAISREFVKASQFKEAHEIAKKLSDEVLQKQIFNEISENALKAVLEIQDETSQAKTLSEISELLIAASKTNEALVALKKIDNESWRAASLSEIATALINAGLTTQALRVAEEIPDEFFCTRTLCYIAYKLFWARKTKSANKALELVLRHTQNISSTYLTKYSIFIIFWHYAKKTAQNRNQV